MPVFERTRRLPHPPGEVFAWHMRPGALERLLPPWEKVRVVGRDGGIADGGTVTVRAGRGPLKLSWKVRHTAFEEGVLFRDEQVVGPFERWTHTHRFSRGPEGGCLVEDKIDWHPPLNVAAAPFVRRIERIFERGFAFRHQRLANDLALHRRYRRRRPLTVAISGSSGFLGRNLRHFLTTGGHRVLRLVRSRAGVGGDAVYWNPARGEVDHAGLEGVDAIVHLAGEPLVGMRWTEARKREILRSRRDGTEWIAHTAARLSPPPRVLVCASAVGYYGSRGNEVLTEESRAGRGFLADVCEAWEKAAAPARRAGIRVAHLRQGVALSPDGGALQLMLPAFRAGAGGRLGSGRQYFPWISLDDTLGLILHTIATPGVRGPINVTAPLPVTNATFAGALGRVLGRPSVLPVPSLAVRALFGEMGRTVLLDGQRAVPAKAEETGYEFLHPSVEEALRFGLGKG